MEERLVALEQRIIALEKLCSYNNDILNKYAPFTLVPGLEKNVFKKEADGIIEKMRKAGVPEEVIQQKIKNGFTF